MKQGEACATEGNTMAGSCDASWGDGMATRLYDGAVAVFSMVVPRKGKIGHWSLWVPHILILVSNDRKRHSARRRIGKVAEW